MTRPFQYTLLTSLVSLLALLFALGWQHAEGVGQDEAQINEVTHGR